MEESEAKEYIKNAEAIKPERAKQDKPRVYYLNLPKKFIAGTVYDPVDKEVIIGAKVTLSDGKDLYCRDGQPWGLRIWEASLFQIQSDHSKRQESQEDVSEHCRGRYLIRGYPYYLSVSLLNDQGEKSHASHPG
jgi:hypothetical protein